MNNFIISKVLVTKIRSVIWFLNSIIRLSIWEIVVDLRSNIDNEPTTTTAVMVPLIAMPIP